MQSLRVVDVLENDGKGLNLTFEVRNGILNHKKSGNPATLEGQAVSLSDRIAYLNHDIEDAMSAGLIKSVDELPAETKILGQNSRERINTMITSIIRTSEGKPFVKMEDHILSATETLRDFMFKHVYFTKEAKGEEEKADRMISSMYSYFIEDLNRLPEIYKPLLEKYDKETVVCDYISGMTDRYAIYVFESVFVPKSFLPHG